jgi:hypothetical protein
MLTIKALPGDFKVYLQAEIDRWECVVRETGLQSEVP